MKKLVLLIGISGIVAFFIYGNYLSKDFEPARHLPYQGKIIPFGHDLRAHKYSQKQNSKIDKAIIKAITRPITTIVKSVKKSVVKAINAPADSIVKPWTTTSSESMPVSLSTTSSLGTAIKVKRVKISKHTSLPSATIHPLSATPIQPTLTKKTLHIPKSKLHKHSKINHSDVRMASRMVLSSSGFGF